MMSLMIGPLSAVVSIVEHGKYLPKTQLAGDLYAGAIGIVMGLVG